MCLTLTNATAIIGHQLSPPPGTTLHGTTRGAGTDQPLKPLGWR